LNETYIKACICKHLFDSFPIQNGLKQGDALSPRLFNFALEYANRVQGNQVGLELKKNTETLIDASKEVGLEINVKETKYILLSRHQSAGQNRDMKRAKCVENVSQLKILGNSSNKSIFNSGGNQEETEFW
jgi:hypothetical protein